MFYGAGAFALFSCEEIIRNASYMPKEMILSLVIAYILIPLLFAMVFLAFAKALKAIRAIKHAVAPCCCSAEKEPAQEESK